MDVDIGPEEKLEDDMMNKAEEKTVKEFDEGNMSNLGDTEEGKLKNIPIAKPTVNSIPKGGSLKEIHVEKNFNFAKLGKLWEQQVDQNIMQGVPKERNINKADREGKDDGCGDGADSSGGDGNDSKCLQECHLDKIIDKDMKEFRGNKGIPCLKEPSPNKIDDEIEEGGIRGTQCCKDSESTDISADCVEEERSKSQTHSEYLPPYKRICDATEKEVGVKILQCLKQFRHGRNIRLRKVEGENDDLVEFLEELHHDRRVNVMETEEKVNDVEFINESQPSESDCVDEEDRTVSLQGRKELCTDKDGCNDTVCDDQEREERADKAVSVKDPHPGKNISVNIQEVRTENLKRVKEFQANKTDCDGNMQEGSLGDLGEEQFHLCIKSDSVVRAERVDGIQSLKIFQLDENIGDDVAESRRNDRRQCLKWFRTDKNVSAIVPEKEKYDDVQSLKEFRLDKSSAFDKGENRIARIQCLKQFQPDENYSINLMETGRVNDVECSDEAQSDKNVGTTDEARPRSNQFHESEGLPLADQGPTQPSSTHNQAKTHQCADCGQLFTLKTNLTRHRLSHTATKDHHCPDCGKLFTQKRHLTQHSLMHSTTKDFKCMECDKVFPSGKALENHLQMHTGVKKFHCLQCGKSFTQKGNLTRHMLIHKGIRKYACLECDKAFIHKCQLKKHALIHSGVKAYKCDQCGKFFTTKDQVSQHIFIHSGIKRFQCQECGKMFSHKSHLKQHALIHTGEKKYECPECKKCFMHKGQLTEHSVVHTRIKEYKCYDCGRLFAHKSHLTRHSMTHTGVKPHECLECGKLFTHKNYLTKHSLVHSGLKRFKCDNCGRCFALKDELVKHVLARHSIFLPPRASHV